MGVVIGPHSHRSSTELIQIWSTVGPNDYKISASVLKLAWCRSRCDRCVCLGNMIFAISNKCMDKSFTDKVSVALGASSFLNVKLIIFLPTLHQLSGCWMLQTIFPLFHEETQNHRHLWATRQVIKTTQTYCQVIMLSCQHSPVYTSSRNGGT